MRRAHDCANSSSTMFWRGIGLEAWQVMPPIGAVEPLAWIDCSGEEAAGSRAVRYETDTQLFERWKYSRLWFPPPHGILTLHRSHREYRMCAANCLALASDSPQCFTLPSGSTPSRFPPHPRSAHSDRGDADRRRSMWSVFRRFSEPSTARRIWSGWLLREVGFPPPRRSRTWWQSPHDREQGPVLPRQILH